MSALQLFFVGTKESITLNWAADIPSTSPVTTISSVAYTLPSNTSPQELTTYANSISGQTSIVGLQGARHSKTYYCSAAATLSNGSIIVQPFTVKGYAAGAA